MTCSIAGSSKPLRSEPSFFAGMSAERTASKAELSWVGAAFCLKGYLSNAASLVFYGTACLIRLTEVAAVFV